MNIQDFSEILKIVLQIANCAIIGYGLYRFLNKPHDSLEQKHETLEKRVDEHNEEYVSTTMNKEKQYLDTLLNDTH